MSARELSVTQVAQALGISIDRAANLVDRVVNAGWSWWSTPQAPEIVGIILCSCGVIAEVSDPQRVAARCPNCNRPWELSPVQ